MCLNRLLSVTEPLHHRFYYTLNANLLRNIIRYFTSHSSKHSYLSSEPCTWTLLQVVQTWSMCLCAAVFEMCLSLLTTVCVPLHSPVCQIRGAEGSLWKLNVQLHILNGSALGALCPHPSLHRISLLTAALLQSFSSQWPLFTLPLSQQSMQSRMNECAFSSYFPLTRSAHVSKCSIN